MLLKPQDGLTNEQKEKYANIGSEYLKSQLKMTDLPLNLIPEKTLSEYLNYVQNQITTTDNSQIILDLKSKIEETENLEEKEQLQD
jgi:hypothetical protein